MTAYERLDLLFQQNNGIVKTAQVLEIGIAKSTFYAYAKQRGVAPFFVKFQSWFSHFVSTKANQE